MLRVWKYELGKEWTQHVKMPVGSKVLTAQYQNGKLCVWALVNDAKTMGNRMFEIVGTGNAAGVNGMDYVGTVQEDALVWHIFTEE